MAETVSVIIMALIFGLGLCGASADQCRTSLESAGYSLSDSSLQEFVAVANDPSTSYYISQHQSELSTAYSEIISGDHSNLKEWYTGSNIREEEFVGGSIEDKEDKLIWADVPSSGSAASITVPNLPSLGDSFGTTKRIYTADGGYFYMLMDTKRVNDQYYNCRYKIMYVDPTGAESQVTCGNFMPDIEHLESYTIDFDVLKTGDNTYNCIIYQTHWSGKQTVTDMPREIEYKLIADPDIADTVYDDTTLPINPDGSITLPDGTVVYPNADGTYTINGVDYSPDKNITDNDILNWILGQLAKDDDITIPSDDADTDNPALDLDDALADAAAYEGDLSEFMLGSGITTVFPFCLPFDFVRGVKLLAVQPKAVNIKIPFTIPEFGSFGGVTEYIELDMEKYSGAFTVVRWLTTFGFLLTLVMISRKIVKGA